MLKVAVINMPCQNDPWSPYVAVPPGEMTHLAHILVAHALRFSFLDPARLVGIEIPERQGSGCVAHLTGGDVHLNFYLLARFDLQGLPTGSLHFHAHHAI